jgi:ribonuclease HI
MTAFSKVPPPRSAPLFAEPDSSRAAPPAGVHIANIDGASRGNPGPAAYAVVIRDPGGKVVLELAKRIETNNVAEYYALLAALDYATSHGIKALRIRSDSELLVRQMHGHYKVKSPDLKPLYERATRLSRQLNYFALEHVRRELNRDADALGNLALDSGNIDPVSSRQKAAERPAQHAPAPQNHTESASARAPAAAPPDSSRLRFRARMEKGALVPVEPLDLPEGTVVEVELRVFEEE